MAKDSSSELSSALVGGADTIVARATPPGRGALAIVRVSGRGVAGIAERVCGLGELGEGWRTRLVDLVGPDGRSLEKAVAISYRRPQSYTGEDMLELVLHGSSYVVDEILRCCVRAGARQAEPGEFTRRAVANGKLDLVQAEAVRDLINAETAWQAHNARLQVAGVLSERVRGLRRRLIAVQSEIEAGLDFVDDEVVIDRQHVIEGLQFCRREISTLLSTSVAGEWIREGVRIAICGRPNAGKSTLFNTLVGDERAIVDDGPGTTRDVLEADMEIGGLRVVLVDTAGIRDTTEWVETEGVRRARAAVSGARGVILMWAADAPVDDRAPSVPEELPVLRVLAKADLLEEDAEIAQGWLAVSCRSGDGLEALRDALVEMVCSGVEDLGGAVAIAARHRRSLEGALADLVSCDIEEPELAAEHLRCAAGELHAIIGSVEDEEVLNAIFATFCIGK